MKWGCKKRYGLDALTWSSVGVSGQEHVGHKLLLLGQPLSR